MARFHKGQHVKFRFGKRDYWGEVTAMKSGQIEVLRAGGNPRNDDDYFVILESEPSLKAIPPTRSPKRSSRGTRTSGATLQPRGNYPISPYIQPGPDGTVPPRAFRVINTPQGPILGLLYWEDPEESRIDFGYGRVWVKDVDANAPQATPSQAKKLLPAWEKAFELFNERPSSDRLVRGPDDLKVGDYVIKWDTRNSLYKVTKLNQKSLRAADVYSDGRLSSQTSIFRYDAKNLYKASPAQVRELMKYMEQAQAIREMFRKVRAP